jgi:hypothetical protein
MDAIFLKVATNYTSVPKTEMVVGIEETQKKRSWGRWKREKQKG